MPSPAALRFTPSAVACAAGAAALALVLSAPERAAVAADEAGFGPSRYNVRVEPVIDCEPYEADSSSTGWQCSDFPDSRGDVTSTRVDQQCFPTEVSLDYHYTTTAGVRKTLPGALTYHCKNGELEGTFDKQWVSYSASSNKAYPLREKGEYRYGKRTGAWTFQTAGMNGEAIVRTARFEEGMEVGVSRTTESGKLVEVACSSRVPVQPSRFFTVDLRGAQADRAALAEKAVAACEAWSTATCESFRKDGLFDAGHSCECDAQCEQPGTCTLSEGRCMRAMSAADCQASRACKAEGLCEYLDGRCGASSAELCKGSAACSEHGLCDAREGVCVATPLGCATSSDCKTGHLCAMSGDRCAEGEPTAASGCTGPCADVVRPPSYDDKPVELGERRSPFLYGLGIGMSAVGFASAVGGIAGWTIRGKQASEGEIIAYVSMLGGGLLVGVGGLPILAVFGQRQPITPAPGTPAKASLTVEPLVGPAGAGLRGTF
ncbi:MAG: hypothetical protein R3B70_30635 [Polyangiaceae bacterium]